MQIKAPSLIKLGACFIYETLIVIAIAFIATWLYLVCVGDASQGLRRYGLQLYLWLVIGVYFVWCWHKKGQTLAMQTWQFKLANQQGDLLSIKDSVLRYAAASVSLGLFGLGFLWVVFDRNQLFLHDKVLKNRLIDAPRNKAK